jgi:hypothetical protein
LLLRCTLHNLQPLVHLVACRRAGTRSGRVCSGNLLDRSSESGKGSPVERLEQESHSGSQIGKDGHRGRCRVGALDQKTFHAVCSLLASEVQDICRRCGMSGSGMDAPSHA